MWKTNLTPLLLLAIIATGFTQQRNRRPSPPFKKKSAGLELPGNATAIRENIVDTFSCEDRIYGYYADIDNDCQIFHICLPQSRHSIRFSFICPSETVFNQATFVCTQTESSIPCEESEKYYKLNEAIGKIEENTEEATTDGTSNEIEATTNPSDSSQRPSSNPQKPAPTSTPDYPTTQFTQRPPKRNQSKNRKQ